MTNAVKNKTSGLNVKQDKCCHLTNNNEMSNTYI